MAFVVKIDVGDTSPVMKVLQRLADFDADKAELFTQIGDEIVYSVRQRFVDGVDIDGKPWVKSWRAIKQQGQTLRDTGRLMNSITRNVLPNGVEVGTDFAYAHVLHFGADIQPKTANYLVFKTPDGGWVRTKQVHIPPRPYLGLNQDDERSILDVVREFMLHE